jgi:hypothetical protein
VKSSYERKSCQYEKQFEKEHPTVYDTRVAERELEQASSQSNNTQTAQNLKVLPEISSFLSEHPEYGTPVAIQAVPDWAQGKRQRVVLEYGGTEDSLLFYIKDDKVVTVYRDGSSGREVVWGTTADYTPAPERTEQSSVAIPAYTVLFTVNQASDGLKYGDVLIPSLSRATPQAKVEKAAQAIAEKEAIANMSIYSTRAAYQANDSESYNQAHPGALEKGYLGSYTNGRFIPPD